MSAVDNLRKYRLGPFAIFDFTATFVGMLIIGQLAKKYVAP